MGEDRTLDRHRECMSAVSQVEASLVARPGDDGAWVEPLVARLGTMLERMRVHFREEEQASLYREVPQRVPRFGRTLERLGAEHATILDEGEALVARARSIDRGRAAPLRELDAAVRLLIARIRRHEAEENEILVTAHWRELGGGD